MILQVFSKDGRVLGEFDMNEVQEIRYKGQDERTVAYIQFHGNIIEIESGMVFKDDTGRMFADSFALRCTSNRVELEFDEYEG